MARRKPYTAIGIARKKCSRVRCGKPARFQWQICADSNVFRPVCADCDVELNAMVMRWAFGRGREADIAAYAKRVATK